MIEAVPPDLGYTEYDARLAGLPHTDIVAIGLQAHAAVPGRRG